MHKSAAVLLGTVLLSTMLGGCAFGDYLAYEPCERYSDELASAIEDAVGENPKVEDIWADGAGVPLCRLTFTLDRDLTSTDPERMEMGDAVDALRSGWEDEVVSSRSYPGAGRHSPTGEHRNSSQNHAVG